MWVPVEQGARKRSASLNSINHDDFKTMNPDTRFMSPRPAPSPPTTPALRYIDSAPGVTKQKRSARSVSPAARWTSLPRKLFSRKTSSSSLRDVRSPPLPEDEFEPPVRAASHDLTSESLRKFLAEESVIQGGDAEQRPSVIIPEDIVEENEDDENFATSAVSEVAPLTVLSPPPSQRSYSPSPPATMVAPARRPPSVPRLEHVNLPPPTSHFSYDSSYYSPTSPQSPDSSTPPPFYHSDEEDDGSSARDESDFFPSPPMNCTEPDAEIPGTASGPFTRSLGAALSTYSLPRSSAGNDDSKTNHLQGTVRNTLGSPALVARNSTDVPVGNTSLLASPIPDAGLDDLVSELSWMAGAIHGKFI
jgi:hypothetical protein